MTKKIFVFYEFFNFFCLYVFFIFFVFCDLFILPEGNAMEVSHACDQLLHPYGLLRIP